MWFKTDGDKSSIWLKGTLALLIILNVIVFFNLQQKSREKNGTALLSDGTLSSADGTVQNGAPRDFTALRDQSVATDRITLSSCTDITPRIARTAQGGEITFTNIGTASHTLRFVGPNGKETRVDIEGGSQARASIPDAGAYFYQCDATPAAGTLFVERAQP